MLGVPEGAFASRLSPVSGGDVEEVGVVAVVVVPAAAAGLPVGIVRRLSVASRRSS